jgi:hypothetical protein
MYAPLGSCTNPLTEALLVWPNALAENITNAAAAVRMCLIFSPKAI